MLVAHILTYFLTIQCLSYIDMNSGDSEEKKTVEAPRGGMFSSFFAGMEKRFQEMLRSQSDLLTEDEEKKLYEKFLQQKANMEDTASRCVTRTRIDELETEVLAEEERKREIDRVLKLMAGAQSVNLCFLLDCTGSMASYINGVKEKIQHIVNISKKMFANFDFSVAFVGYRDHCDGNARIIILDFTESIIQFQSHMTAVTATGGGDAPEDVFGGIEEVTKLSWSKHTRILFHIADSPCHGNRFHDPSVSDDYPNGDPRGLKIEDLLAKLQEMNILYWFAKLGNTTDQMIKEFQSLMSINEIDLASADDLVQAVVGSISVSVEIMEKNAGDEVVREGVTGEVKFQIVKELPHWESITAKKVSVRKIVIPDDVKNLRRDFKIYNDDDRSIIIANNPFAEGKLRIAFHGKDKNDDGKPPLVLKQFKFTSENQLDRYVEQMEIQCVAVALSRKFNAIKPKGTRDVHFADVSVVTATEGTQEVHYAMENYIPGEYIKFNSNSGFVNESSYTATLNAFSHWTYLASNR